MQERHWNPADLLQLSGGYWSTCALHAAVKIGLFSPLSGRAYSAVELAALLGADVRALGMLLNALAAMGLLEKTGDIYNATPSSKEYLDRSSPGYLGHIMMHHHHLMAGWSCLDEAIVSGRPTRPRVSHGNDEALRESFLMGMFNLAMLQAPKIIPLIDLGGRKRLLDLGGGPGTYAIHFCLHNPGLSATIFDLPATRPFAEQTVARFGLSDRVSFRSGDFDAESVGNGYDVAWLSHVLHGEGPQGCAALLAKAVDALEPGGMILVQEFILDDTLDSPLFPALFSLNMLIGTEDGQAYSQAELTRMLNDAGVREIQRLGLDLPNGAGVICGVV
jgi:hypothetical protein